MWSQSHRLKAGTQSHALASAANEGATVPRAQMLDRNPRC
jgi:hypothetical protein